MRILDKLNSEYSKLHTTYEELFWDDYMGNKEVARDLQIALEKRDLFRSNTKLLNLVEKELTKAKGEDKKRLNHWKNFFQIFQTPKEAIDLKNEIHKLEAEIARIRANRKEGYIDPYKNIFIEASENKMRTIVRTENDEKIRKACFDSLNELPLTTLDIYVDILKKRNQFAKILGFKNFYEYKLSIDEKISHEELLNIFDKLYEKTKPALDYIKELEKEKPGISKPWNFSYMISGDFIKEEDPYFQLDDALIRWGRSFSAINADLAGGKLILDLLDRKGKHNNGFCQWPKTVSYKNKKIVPGESRISCNAVLGQIGAGYSDGHNTLFHEGGHAAHYLNSIQKDVILNHEYPPSTVSWAETQSMFMDTMLSSIEWKTRYAKNKNGEKYPFELFERKLRKNAKLWPLDILSMTGVVKFESLIYREENLTKDFVLKTANETYKKYSGLEHDSLRMLNVSHIYSWESSAYYHGYCLAELNVAQWREYFYKKYGYIVDNPNIGKEMKKVWKLGASQPSKDFIKLATGKKLSPDAYIRSVMVDIEKQIKESKKRIKKLESIKEYSKPINLNGTVYLVDGNEKIADSKNGFEKMAETFSKWLENKKNS